MMFNEDKPYYAGVGPRTTLWGPILEKAFAKIKGSYSAVKGGYLVSGLRALTGAPVYNYNKY